VAPDRGVILFERHVLIEILSTLVPVSTITTYTSVLEVESFVAGHACVELGLKPDDSNLLVHSTTCFGTTPAPDLEKVRALRNLLKRLVPFILAFLLFEVKVLWKCTLVV